MTAPADADPGDGTGGGTGGGVTPGAGGGGSGAAGMQTVLSGSVRLPSPGVVDVDGAALQSFAPGSSSAWRFELWIDGQMVWDPHGTAPGDVVPIGGTKYCAAGDRAVELRWAASTNITLGRRFLKVRGFNNVSG